MAHKRNAKNYDLVTGPVFLSLAMFALPLLGSNIFQQFYNTVDAMIVGNFLGDTSLAAIGVCAPVYDLLVGFALGLGNGLAIVTARSYGAGDMQLLKRSAAASIVIGAAISLFLTGIASLFLYPLLQLLNTPAGIIGEAYSYISLITAFIPVMFTYNLCSALLLAIGDSIMPLVFLVLSSCFNILLDILFITHLGMGIRGAAVATVISQGLSLALCILYIWKKCTVLVPERRHFRIEASLYSEMLGQGLSMGFMNSIVSIGTVLLQYGINGLGYQIIAAHTAARKLFQFTIMPLAAMSMASSTFVSQNKGAGHGRRILQAVKDIYIYSVVIAALMTALMWACAPALIKWLSGSSDSVILDNGTRYLRFCAPFYSVLGWLTSTRKTLQGLGKKMLPLVSSVIELIGKILFVILWIPRYSYTAVIWCEPVIWCCMEVQLIFAFLHDPFITKWRKKGETD